MEAANLQVYANELERMVRLLATVEVPLCSRLGCRRVVDPSRSYSLCSACPAPGLLCIVCSLAAGMHKCACCDVWVCSTHTKGKGLCSMKCVWMSGEEVKK